LITSEVVPLRPALPAFRKDWDRLYSSGRFEPCVSFAWSAALIANQLGEHDDLSLVVLRNRGSIIGLVPLMRDRQVLAGLPVYSVRPIAERSLTHSDLLIADHDVDAVAAFLRAVTSLPGPVDELRLARLLASERTTAALAASVERSKLPFRLATGTPSFFLSLPPRFDTYLASRSGKFRNHLRRMEKHLAARGRLELQRARGAADVESLYSDLLEIERNSWKFDHGTSIAGQLRQRGFYRALSDSAAAAGSLHLSVLRLDATPIAYNLGLVERGRYWYLKTSYVAALREASPATVARAWLIRSLIDEGVRELDFPAEPYEWERQWTGELREHKTLTVYGRSARARLLRLAYRAKDALRAPADDEWHYADPRDHKAEP
jgi:CelD/BcsL family acetyltransferase involved in cellulose biosynthesis